MGIRACLAFMLGVAPVGLGADDGKLGSCPSSPNCVCSCQDPSDSHYVAPITIIAPGTTQQRLLEAIRKMPRTRVVEETAAYIHAECRSKIFGFVDDLECLIDNEAGVIHVRSASRSGYYDFGVNRARVEQLRKWMGTEGP